MKKESICVYGGYTPQNGDTNVAPLCVNTTYAYDTPEQMAHLFDVPKDGHIYTRISNPTTSVFEQKVAQLEGGVGAMACSSGMAATTLAILTVASAGDNILAFSTLYGGTFNLFTMTLPKLGIEVRLITPDMDDNQINSLIDSRTKMFFAESLANPAMVVFDFERYSAICKKHGLLLVIDNTIPTPILVRPFEFGANVVIHSSTKYLDGHAVCVGGVIVDGGNFDFENSVRYQEFNNPDPSYHGVIYSKEGGSAAYILKARMQYMRDIGACMSPFNAFLTNLGTETLALRMERHSSNALHIAKALSVHPKIAWVKYCGLETDKYHDLAKKYFTGGYSGMISVGIKGGRVAAADFIRHLNLIRQLTHIADIRSCVLHPASTTHRQLSEASLLACGIEDNLVRISVGIEAVEDTLADITQALAKI